MAAHMDPITVRYSELLKAQFLMGKEEGQRRGIF